MFRVVLDGGCPGWPLQVYGPRIFPRQTLSPESIACVYSRIPNQITASVEAETTGAITLDQNLLVRE